MGRKSSPRSKVSRARFDRASRRLDALKARIDPAKPSAAVGRDGDPGDAAEGYRLALRVGTEMVAAVAVGSAIGVTIDYWLDSGPLFLIILFFLGAAAGIRNIWKWSTKSLGGSSPPPPSRLSEKPSGRQGGRGRGGGRGGG